MIELTTPEWKEAEEIGRQWHAAARQRGQQDQTCDPERSQLAINIEGAIAEMAVAKWLDLLERWRSKARRCLILPNRPDVGLFHVRGTKPPGGLVLKPGDTTANDAAYLLVHVSGAAGARLIGWAFGWEIHQKRFWRANWPQPAHCMPARRTACLDSALAWYRSKLQEIRAA